MKRKVLVEWLDALRSGEYLQTKKALKDDLGYCPLGVLCEISKLGTWEPEPNSKKLQYLGQINYLPEKVAEWAGMSQKEKSSVVGFMIVYNDTQNLSFLELADLIEKKYGFKGGEMKQEKTD